MGSGSNMGSDPNFPKVVGAAKYGAKGNMGSDPNFPNKIVVRAQFY
ncbi:hypothetical protein N9R48_00515 [Rickettsiales bacterium]|nr:hypothetical protein [Rickettsiales bacterium]